MDQAGDKSFLPADRSPDQVGAQMSEATKLVGVDGSFAAETRNPDLDRLTARAPGFEGPRELAYEIEAAMERGELRLVYQPVMDLHSGRIVGAEALARWHHVARGDISPGTFIPVAESCGLVGRLGAWALRTACETARDIVDLGMDDFWIAVNAAADQFRDPGFRDLVDGTLEGCGIDPRHIEVELTESAFLDHRDTEASANLRWLRGRGVRLAMDDFGTGYSSLAYLADLPLDKIKLDRAFLRGGDVQHASAAIIHAVATIGRDLLLEVQAEGIETPAQARTARELGCDLGQGYQIAPPLEAGVFRALIEELRPISMTEPPTIPCQA